MKEVYDLYDKCTKWLNGDDTCTPNEIIEEAVDVLADIPELDVVWEKCMNSNGDQCEAEEIVEELSNCLDEYFDEYIG